MFKFFDAWEKIYHIFNFHFREMDLIKETKKDFDNFGKTAKEVIILVFLI